MPKKIIFSREDILEAAFQIFCREGFASLSSRKIAASLESSTAPVYTSFTNVDEIREALLEKATALLVSYTEKEYTHNIFLNIGVGLLMFARDYSLVYRTLFIETNHYRNILEDFTERNFIQMKKEPSLNLLSDEDKMSILKKLTVYTHGLACCICSGMMEDTANDTILHLLDEVGDDIIGATLLRRGKLETFLKQWEDRYHEKDFHPQRPER